MQQIGRLSSDPAPLYQLIIQRKELLLQCQKVGFVSLGCPKNLVDSEVMMGILARAGYEITPRAGEADVLVVNTCSFIEPAQQESVQSILEMAEYKKFGRAQKLIVAGCMVERFRNEIREQIPEVDAVIGTGEVEKILAACEGELRPDDAENSGATELPTYLYHDLTPRILATPRHTAYIKINEGCDHPCTFCVIPQLRGKFRSRRFESVMREAENLAAAGVREISLIGQDTTYYGEDLGLRDGLPTLLERLAQIEDLHWVRFLYCYPNRITPRLLDTIAAHPAPGEISGHAAAARQPQRSGAHEARIERRRVPENAGKSCARAIPGVSHSHFVHRRLSRRNRKRFPRAVRFRARRRIRLDGRLLLFRRRHREKFRAAKIKWTRKPSRAAATRSCPSRRKSPRANLQSRIGQRLQVMLEGPSKDTDLIWEARLEGMAPEIDGKVYITDFAGVNDAADLPLPGTLATIEITEAQALRPDRPRHRIRSPAPESSRHARRRLRQSLQFRSPILRLCLISSGLPGSSPALRRPN